MQYDDNAENTEKSKRGRKPKYVHIIILPGVNAKEIHKRYKQNITDNFEKYCKDTIVTRQNYFYEIEKTDRFVVMKDHVDYGCLPFRTDLRCRYDHHCFETSPIGIPIKYISKRRKTNSKDTEETTDQGINDYFLTDGVVCSFPCLLAFIQEHQHIQKYRNSMALTYLMYRKMYNKELKAPIASDISCLTEYGGEISIDEFRRNFGNCYYTITENIKRPYMVAVGSWIEKKRAGVL